MSFSFAHWGSRNDRFLVLLILAFWLVFCSGPVGAAGRAGELYEPSETVLEEVAEARIAALEEGKKVLVVMGANWCHDSRALADRLQQEPLKSLVDANYQTVFVDVGFLELGPDVVSGLGTPVYYATPTVLILDPQSGAVINADNRHQWGHADLIEMDESVAYFSLMAERPGDAEVDHPEPSGELARLMSEIDALESAQAERLYSAYAVLGPLLSAYAAGNEPDDFQSSWVEVRDFRMQIPPDMEALRAEAKQRVSDDEVDIVLNYPEYPVFTWESGTSN